MNIYNNIYDYCQSIFDLTLKARSPCVLLWLNPRLPKKNFRAHAAMLFKVQPTYCFLLFFYSPPTAVLLNLSRQVLPSDFWLNIKSKKSYGIEYTKTTSTKPRLLKKNFCAHAAMLFKVLSTYCFLMFFTALLPPSYWI